MEDRYRRLMKKVVKKNKIGWFSLYCFGFCFFSESIFLLAVQMLHTQYEDTPQERV